jgi:hypothetical protein
MRNPSESASRTVEARRGAGIDVSNPDAERKHAMTRWLTILTAVILGMVLCGPTSGEDKKSADQDKSADWMKKKLELSQNMLAGLTESDFEKIRRNAQAMSLMDYLEKWARAGQADYKQQLTYFEYANQELIRQSKEKNLDGALLAYYQLTASCVQCHKIVREAKK